MCDEPPNFSSRPKRSAPVILRIERGREEAFAVGYDREKGIAFVENMKRKCT
jgi:hypothetical protein